MPSIIKKSNRVRAAKDFLTDVDDGVSKFYAGLSGTTSWGGADGIDDIAPPYDSISESSDFWDELFGIIRITSENTLLVVPRVNWTSGNGYNKFDLTHDAAHNLPFYVIGSNNYVYECTTIPTNLEVHANTVKIRNPGTEYTPGETLTVIGGTGTATTLNVDTIGAGGEITSLSIVTAGTYTVVPTDPVLMSGSTNNDAEIKLSWIADPVSTEPTHTVIDDEQVGGDGYGWTALYNAGAYSSMLTSNWLPVDPANEIKLGADSALIRCYIPDPVTTGNKIGAIEYRKIGILMDPKTSGGAVVNITYGDTTDFSDQYSDQDTGVVMMLDHRTPILRQASQTETVFVILEF